MASHLRISLSSILVLGTLLWGASQASAQNAADKAAAESLFDRGLSLLKEGKFNEACERLEQSQAIERGIGTMLYLAECYEKIGRTASAWALFREAASLAQAEGQAERADAGKRRAEKLEKSLSRLAVQVPVAHKLPGLRVTDNGSLIQPTVYGLALPVDPGTHRVEASAPGYLPWTGEVKVGAQADSAELRVPQLEKDPNAAEVPVAVAPTPAEAASSGPDSGPAAAASAPQTTRMSNTRIAGLALGAVGVVGIVVGAVMGGLAIKNDKASEDRVSNGQCDEKCADLSDKAIKQATVSTAGWIAGGVLVAGGLLTFFLGPKHQRADVALRVDHQSASLRVGGVF
ncbi:MAG TPA: hypothetical protein VFZ61_08990 [Polyangiales bacterium]